MEYWRSSRITSVTASSSAALVVDGNCLKTVLTSNLKKDFIRLCLLCKTVLCCRVTPSQKAEVCISMFYVMYVLIGAVIKSVDMLRWWKLSES